MTLACCCLGGIEILVLMGLAAVFTRFFKPKTSSCCEHEETEPCHNPKS